MSEQEQCKHCTLLLNSNEVIWCRDDSGRIALCKPCWEIVTAISKDKGDLSPETKSLMQANPDNIRSCLTVITLLCPNCKKEITSESIEKERLDFEPYCPIIFVKCEKCRQIYRIDICSLKHAGIT